MLVSKVWDALDDRVEQIDADCEPVGHFRKIKENIATGKTSKAINSLKIFLTRVCLHDNIRTQIANASLFHESQCASRLKSSRAEIFMANLYSAAVAAGQGSAFL